jgi:hypothetical protein
LLGVKGVRDEDFRSEITAEVLSRGTVQSVDAFSVERTGSREVLVSFLARFVDGREAPIEVSVSP